MVVEWATRFGRGEALMGNRLAILEDGQVTLSSFQPEDIGMERIEIDQVGV